jgi:hypothetical protein
MLALFRGIPALLGATLSLFRATFALLRAELPLFRAHLTLLRATFALFRAMPALFRAELPLLGAALCPSYTCSFPSLGEEKECSDSEKKLCAPLQTAWESVIFSLVVTTDACPSQEGGPFLF